MRLRILPLILAGTGGPASAEEVRQTLSVSATVIDSCSVSTEAGTSPLCTTGTRWQSSTQRLSTSSTPEPPGAQKQSSGQVSYLTITY